MSVAARLREPLLAILAGVTAAALIFGFVQRQLSGAWLAFGGPPEVLALLEASRDDQRELAAHAPAASEAHRQRFDQLQAMIGRLRILEHSRGAIIRRYEQILLAGAIFTALAIVAAAMIHQRRREARDRRRLEGLENLSAWQEAARRHAHEMRTPLTSARLELTRLDDLARALPASPAGEIRHAARSAIADLEQLGRFTRAFTSFARLPSPQRRRQDFGALVAELARTFADAWPGLALHCRHPPRPVYVRVDRDMLRQVLVNLCDNSHQALAGRPGTVRFTFHATSKRVRLDVADDGPGVGAAVRERLFEPYTTTRSVGEGMGLGLAIARKILLDHDGDLELVRSSSAGTVFRLTLPREDRT